VFFIILCSVLLLSLFLLVYLHFLLHIFFNLLLSGSAMQPRVCEIKLGVISERILLQRSCMQWHHNCLCFANGRSEWRHLCISAVWSTGCPADFASIASVNGCYKVVNHNLNWAQAGQNCRSLNKDAHLLVINDAAEQTAVAEMLNSMSGQCLI